MSPRKAAVLRDGDGQDLRRYLVGTAARLIDQRGSAGLTVRDIAREAQVADGVLYNYFQDKDDLLAHALLAHVGMVMGSAPPMPAAGTGTVTDNLGSFIDRGFALLARVTPAFAGLLAQQGVLSRFHAMVGGDGAFGAATADDSASAERQPAPDGRPEPDGQPGSDGQGDPDGQADPDTSSAPPGPRGLPDMLKAYLRAEQQLGRVNAAADIDAVATLVVGAIHGEILPRVLFSPPGSPVTIPPDLAPRLARTILSGIAPRS
jgi:AcrR family transcriptional regulator